MSREGTARTKGRARTALGWLGGTLGTLVTFAAATAAGLALHLDLPATRRLVASEVTNLLAEGFRGRLAIERVGRLGVRGVEGVRVRVLDPEGRQVLLVDGVTLRISFLDVGRSALLGSGNILADVRGLSIDYADVSLDADAAGVLRIQSAFEPRDNEPAAPDERGLDIEIRRARVTHAWVHGQMKDAPLLDADLDQQEGRVQVTPLQTRVDVDESRIRTRSAPRGADLDGTGEAHLALPSPTGSDLGLAAGFVGAAGSIPLAVEASLDGEDVDVIAEVRGRAVDVRALVPEAPVYADVAAHAEAHGELSHLVVSGDATIGAGTAALLGDVEIGDEIRARAAVWARGIDIRAFSPDAPASSLGADLAASVVAPAGGGVHGSFDLDVVPGMVAGQRVPAASVQGSFTEASVRGEMAVAEPGAPIRGGFDVHPEGGVTVAQFTATSLVPRLEAISRLGPVARGRADLRLEGRVELETQRVEAHAWADLASITRDGVRVDHARVDARVRGTFDAPVVDATVEAQDVFAGSYAFERVNGAAVGPLTNLAVWATAQGKDGTLVDARVSMQSAAALTLRGVRVAITRGGENMIATADTIRIAGADVAVEDATIEGLGEPARATVRFGPGGTSIRAESRGLDLARVAHLARAEQIVRGGKLGFDVDLAVHGKHATGKVVVDLEGALLTRGRVDAHVDARLMDRKVFGNLAAEMAGVGHLYLNTSTLELGGPTLDPASWRAATGKVQIDGEADLARVAALLPEGTLPAGELRGLVTVEGEIGRTSAQARPDFELSARTKGLVIAAPQQLASRVDGTKVLRPPAWRSAGIDVAVDAGIEAKTGKAHVEARVLDAHGLVVGFDTKAELPYDDLLADPGKALTRLESVPFAANVWVPRRALDQLPPVLRTKGMKGTVELSAHGEGTALEPRLSFVAKTTGIKGGVSSSVAAPTDAELSARYEGGTGDVRLVVRAREGVVLDATTRVHARASDLFDPPPGGTPWDASGLARLDRFPLHSVTRLADMRVRGHVSGEIGLADLHKDARAQAKLRIDDLRVGRAAYTGGFVHATLDGRGLDGAARLDQSDGFAETHAKIAGRWGKELAPKIDESGPAELSLEAKQFRAAALLPFVDGTLTELDGRIDARARIELGAQNRKLAMSGTARLTDGIFEVASMGEEFRDARATVVLTPDGVLRIDDVSAKGVTGQVMASAVARLDGLGLSGARASVRIPKGHAIPLSVEGEGMGEISGDMNIDAKVSPDKRTVNVVVDVPKLQADIPEVKAHSLQELEADETVRIGVHRTPDKLTLVPLGPPPPEARPGEATRFVVQLRLGKRVEIRRGKGMRVQLEGNPTLTIGDDAQMTGQILLRGGFLDVQGKKFEIEKGTITFVGDPTNPIVVVTAGWIAPDGTQVYADFVGPLETGKVTLRSEPSLPRNEILSLILFGSQGGNQAPAPGQEPNGTSRAVGLGGGIATQGLNRAMEDMTGLDVTARVDTTNSANPRPELEFQISKSVSLQIAYVLGVPPPGENPDKSLLTLDWRFFKNLSLETTVGDRGSSIFDLIWRKRY